MNDQHPLIIQVLLLHALQSNHIPHMLSCANMCITNLTSPKSVAEHQCIRLSKKNRDVLSDSNVTLNDVRHHFPEIQILQDGTFIESTVKSTKILSLAIPHS